MTDYNYHLNQLPNFLITQVNTAAGALHGLSLDQIIARYRSATEHVIAVKRAKHWPGFGDHDILFGIRNTKTQLDANFVWLAGMASDAGFDIHNITEPHFLLAQCDYESLLFLNIFHSYLVSAQAQLNEAARQHAQRQAEEAARQLAQRHAEEAARQNAQRQAEEAARQIAQRHAEEAARQLAQRQAEEAARLLAQHQAETAARELALRQAEEAARQMAKLEAEAVAREIVRLQAEAEAKRVAEAEADLKHLLQLRPGVEKSAVRLIVEQAKVKVLKGVERIEAESHVTDAAGNVVKLIPEAMILAEVDKFAFQLETDARVALAEFSRSTGPDTGIPELDAFNAMLYALKQTGLEVDVPY